MSVVESTKTSEKPEKKNINEYLEQLDNYIQDDSDDEEPHVSHNFVFKPMALITDTESKQIFKQIYSKM